MSLRNEKGEFPNHSNLKMNCISENIIFPNNVLHLNASNNTGSGDKSQMNSFIRSDKSTSNKETIDLSSFCVALENKKPSMMTDSPLIFANSNFMPMGDFSAEACFSKLLKQKTENKMVNFFRSEQALEPSIIIINDSIDQNSDIGNSRNDEEIDNSKIFLSSESSSESENETYSEAKFIPSTKGSTTNNCECAKHILNSESESDDNKTSRISRSSCCIEKLTNLVKTSEDIQIEIQSIMDELQAVVKTSYFTQSNKAAMLIIENISNELIENTDTEKLSHLVTNEHLFCIILVDKIVHKLISSSVDYILDIVLSRYFYFQEADSARDRSKQLHNSRSQLIDFLRLQQKYCARDQEKLYQQLMDIVLNYKTNAQI